MVVPHIAEPDVAAAYLPLKASSDLGLDVSVGAAVVIAPGVAATCAHNANLVDPKSVIGIVQDYDLMFFRTEQGRPPPLAAPVVGASVTAYGEDSDGGLRRASGVVRKIVPCAGCSEPAYFIFSNPRRGGLDAGPGFSGGPVVDGAGRVVGITFGYKDEGGQRLIYAYDMARVTAEYARAARSHQAALP